MPQSPEQSAKGSLRSSWPCPSAAEDREREQAGSLTQAEGDASGKETEIRPCRRARGRGRVSPVSWVGPQ